MTATKDIAQAKTQKRPPRFVIATPICDGHDVAATAITRILRAQGAEAVYIGFNKSAQQIVKAAWSLVCEVESLVGVPYCQAIDLAAACRELREVLPRLDDAEANEPISKEDSQ